MRGLCQIRDEEIQHKRLTSSGTAENHRVGHIVVMEVQKVWGVMVGLQNLEVFLPELLVTRLATMEGEQKRKIGVIGVQQIQVAKVGSIVARNRCEEGMQEVVFLFVKLRVVDAEHFVEVGTGPVHF